MKRLNKVYIRFKLADRWANKSILEVKSDKFKVLIYELSGNSGSYSMSNLQLKQDLPATLDDYTDVHTLAKDIANVINKYSVENVDSLVFAKSI